MNKKFIDRLINSSTSILSALKIMDKIGVKSLLVVDNDRFSGILSIGDIQRAIIKNIDLGDSVNSILRKNPKFATPSDNLESIKQLMFTYRMEFLPVVDQNHKVVDIFFWEDVFGLEQHLPITPFNLPVVIMAGGFGSRLKPLTNVLPKPLLPIGEKTMIEEIIDRFSRYGCNNFYISVNYKSDLIKYYISKLQLPYRIEFFEEHKPLGTAGSLSLLKDLLTDTFFVSNCDILVDQDYSEILKYHKENKNEITIVAALKNLSLPYGTIETGENGQLLSIIEKPEITFKINTGIYILEPSILQDIPDDAFFHITQLIENVLARKGNVGVFPVNDKSWLDIGEWKDYLKNLKVL